LTVERNEAEINHYQRTRGFVIPAQTFHRLLKEIMNDIHEAKIAPGVGQRWTKGALAALHVGAESMLTHRLDAAYILFPLLANLSVQITQGAERKTLTRRDFAVLAQAMDALGLKKDPVCKYYKSKTRTQKIPLPVKDYSPSGREEIVRAHSNHMKKRREYLRSIKGNRYQDGKQAEETILAQTSLPPVMEKGNLGGESACGLDVCEDMMT